MELGSPGFLPSVLQVSSFLHDLILQGLYMVENAFLPLYFHANPAFYSNTYFWSVMDGGIPPLQVDAGGNLLHCQQPGAHCHHVGGARSQRFTGHGLACFDTGHSR